MNYPTKTEPKAMGQGNLCECFFLLFFAVIHSTCKLALRKESTIKRFVDYLELFDDQHRKSTRII